MYVTVQLHSIEIINSKERYNGTKIKQLFNTLNENKTMYLSCEHLQQFPGDSITKHNKQRSLTTTNP